MFRGLVIRMEQGLEIDREEEGEHGALYGIVASTGGVLPGHLCSTMDADGDTASCLVDTFLDLDAQSNLSLSSCRS